MSVGVELVSPCLVMTGSWILWLYVCGGSTTVCPDTISLDLFAVCGLCEGAV